MTEVEGETVAKFTLLLTQHCNLRCSYCYIEKHRSSMPLRLAEKIVDFIFSSSSPSEMLDIGFFGGEPLLELDLLKAITGLIKAHPSYPSRCVLLSVTTNGTVFSEEIAETLKAEGIQICISCDGPPEVHDLFRRFADGRPSSAIVESSIRQAVATLDVPRINAVFHPLTFRKLPETVAYLAELGVKQIYLNPDFSASWSEADLSDLADVYARVGELYMSYHKAQAPCFISLIDSKIACILARGYRPEDRCKMGQCGLARPRVLAGGAPAWVIASHEPSIEPCGATGNSRVDA